MTDEQMIDQLQEIRRNYKSEYDEALMWAIECIRHVPKHGEWIKKTEGLPHLVIIEWYVCSECGVQKSEETPFCPNCGASMSANDRQVTGKLNSEIEKSKGKILPDFCDGLLYSMTNGDNFIGKEGDEE